MTANRDARERGPIAPSPSLPKRKGERSPEDGTAGFTLLDALVALAILSLVMTFVPKGLATVRRMQERSNEWVQARLVAQAVLERELAGGLLRPGVYGGVISNRTWRAVLAPDPAFGLARRDGDDQRHALLDARLTVEMAGRPLELETVLIGVLP